MRLNQNSKSGSAKQSVHSNSSSTTTGGGGGGGSGTGTTAASGAASGGATSAKANSVSRNRDVKLQPAGSTTNSSATAVTTKPKGGSHQLSSSKTVLNPQNIGSVPRNPTQHQRTTALLKAGAAEAPPVAAGSSSLGLSSTANDLMTEKSRRVLEEIQKTKNSLLKQQQLASSSSAAPGNLFLASSGVGPTSGGHFPQLQIPGGPIPGSLPNLHSPSVIIGNPIDASNIGLSPVQRSALHLLQQANQTSFGSYISTDSHFGNSIFPVLPRLVNNNIANSNSTSTNSAAENNNSSGVIKIT